MPPLPEFPAAAPVRRRLARFSTAGAALLLSFGALSTSPAGAEDWPQILGPRRDGTTGERLAERLPSPLEPAWTAQLGAGFAGPAVAGQRLILFHRVDNRERVDAFHAETGQRIWQQSFPASYQGGVSPDDGPRCVPLIHRERVYLFGAAGNLHCLALEDGEPLWSRAVYRDWSASEGYFGAGSTPVALGDLVLVNAGGRNGAGVIAFDGVSGDVAWKATDEGASYASPVVLPGGETVLFVTRFQVVALQGDTGEELFRFPFGMRGPTVNAATPLAWDDRIFVTASYGIGARLLEVAEDQRAVEQRWSSDEVLSSQYATPVFRGGYLYGSHGREDVGRAELRCVHAESGEVQWSRTGYGVAHVVLADALLLIQTVEGELVLVRADPRAYDELDRRRFSSNETRALPAVAGGWLYTRDNRGRNGTLYAVRLEQPAAP